MPERANKHFDNNDKGNLFQNLFRNILVLAELKKVVDMAALHFAPHFQNKNL